MTALRTLLGPTRPALARAGAAVRTGVGVVSPTGRVVGLLATAAGVAGGALGWPELLDLALTLAAGLLVSLAFLVGRARFRVGIDLTPRRVVAGDRAFGRLVVVNTGSTRSTPTRLEVPVGRSEAVFGIPGLAPGAQHEELFAVPTARRAVVVAGPAVSVRGDALGLVRRAVRLSDPVELFVHPATTRLRPSAAGLVRDLEGEATRTLTSNDLAFHALRPYEPGDDRRNVHWRTTARTGRLMVRQFTETRRSRLVLLHHADAAGYGMPFRDDEFELGVSVMASIARQVLREGTRARIASGAAGSIAELRTATPTAMLDDSSRIEPLPGDGTLRDFARDATRRLPPPSVLLLVVGPSVPIADLRAVDALSRGETRTVGVRVEAGGEPRLSVVSGLTVATVGALPDLPKLLGRPA